MPVDWSLDAKTRPSPNLILASYKNAHYYGLIVDQKDRVWAAAARPYHRHVMTPNTEMGDLSYPTQPSGARRPKR